MKLIYPLGNTLVLNEGGRGRVPRKTDSRSVSCEKFITTEQVAVGAGGIEVIENGMEHLGRDLSATLTERRSGHLNVSIVQNLS